MRLSRSSPLVVGTLVFLVSIIPWVRFDVAWAASLTAMSDTMSSAKANDTGVTHTVAFTTATTDLVQELRIHFTTTLGGGTVPAGLDLSGATLGTVSGLGSGWSLDASFASTGYLIVSRGTAATVNSGVAASVELQNITNSAIDDCQPSNDVLQDTCNVRVGTYSDLGSTQVDTGDTTYTVTEDPFLNFLVEDVPSGQTHNGVTSNIGTTATSVSFGHLGTGTVRYGTQKITISTNAPHGYVVYAKLADDWTGAENVNNLISPFGATSATWTTPQSWSSPNGGTSNSNSGWFGGNTSDTRPIGWSSASGKFGPIGITDHPIIQSSGPERSGAVIYVSYAIEVNIVQPSDVYSANLVYDVQPIF